nr:hypothetical protein PanWU01x14_350390 [Ipomoea batatas]
MALASKLISTSMLLPPLFPGYKYSIPSNLLLVPLLTLSGFPNPKSTSYTLNLGELPTATQFIPASLYSKIFGLFSHSAFRASMAFASCPDMAFWIRPAPNSGGLAAKSPAAVTVKIAWIRLPKMGVCLADVASPLATELACSGASDGLDRLVSLTRVFRALERSRKGGVEMEVAPQQISAHELMKCHVDMPSSTA